MQYILIASELVFYVRAGSQSLYSRNTAPRERKLAYLAT